MRGNEVIGADRVFGNVLLRVVRVNVELLPCLNVSKIGRIFSEIHTSNRVICVTRIRVISDEQPAQTRHDQRFTIVKSLHNQRKEGSEEGATLVVSIQQRGTMGYVSGYEHREMFDGFNLKQLTFG